MRAIAQDEPVVVIAADDTVDELTSAIVSADLTGLPIWLNRIPTNDAWIRDYGATFVSDAAQLLAIDWKYNAWGEKYPPFDLDQQVAKRMVQQMPPHVASDQVLLHESDICLEGGAIEINADGVLMSTRSCLLNQNRNPGISVAKIERELRDCLGAKQILWLSGGGISGDDTDGHIDQIARFVPGNKIVMASPSDADDPAASELDRNADDVKTQIDRLDLPYEVVPLPVPSTLHDEGRRLPASYCNFYITNRTVIVPQFDRPQDEVARRTLASLFPDRVIKALPSVHLVAGLGSFHCLTQQQPRPVPRQ